MNFTSDYLAIRALETRLAVIFGIGGEYSLKYATYGGVDVRMRTDEDSEPENIGRPLLLLEQSSGARSDWSSMAGEYRDVEATVTSFVTDASGAQQGAANPVTSDELLARDLVLEFETNYATWRDLGLMNIAISAGSLEVGELTRKVAHRVTFKYSRD